ncbi:thiamine pyrophosphate-dependent enzyme [Metallumcola ferriviriculae]|uniref:Thiamine pyrophosphate-dependent enzyme n=1 Tax=Metallumcola ferriviriculae TaxID=3039180 RepID=A0AAU0UKS9_9FIRM|nr:thiamine pyrophosphate-dependent enzyme [Desulfitibacteraceae bacterium MK1]
MKTVFQRPKALMPDNFHYCSGCTHGLVHRLIAETIDELDVRESSVGVASVGCSVLTYEYFNMDMQQASHGRAPAVATGIKRVSPETLVFTYQGDGDLAAIGTSETIHAAARGENITIIFINNSCFGMTGGQMAPTTLVGQKTTTSPQGRNAMTDGYPLKIPEMLAAMEGAAYISRVSVHNPKSVKQAKKAITKAFTTQLQGLGFSLVEVLSTCPTNWRKTPLDSLKWLEDNMIPNFPLGEFKVDQEVS